MPPVAIAIVAAIFPAAATTFVLGVSIATIIGSIIGSLALSALAVALSSKSGRRDAGIRVNSTITGGTAAQFFPVGVTATKGAFAYPKLTHGGKGGTQFLTHVIVLGHKPHIRINRVALEGEWADIDWTRGAGSTASTPTETPSDTGGLPTPTRPRAASPTLLITTATTVTGGAFCTFQYDDNSSFSSPSAVYDTAKNNSHAALWTLPAGTTYVRARLTTGIRDTGSKSAWSPTSTHTRGATTNTDSIYLKSIARPDTPTGGTSTENHTPTGWSRSSLTPTQRQNVYRVQRTRTYTDGVFISATAWAGLRVWRRRTSRSSGPRGSQIPRAVGDDSDSSEYGSPVLGTHEGFAFARYYDGTQTAADPMMLKMYGNHPLYPWTADMIGAGISYVIMTYKRDPKVFTSEPDPIFEVQGIPLYDIRKDSTKGGSGAHRWGTESTYEYTENPMVIAHNLALGISLMGGYTYGGNWDFGMIPANTIIAAMNECDAKVTERGASVPKYRCGLELAVDEEPRLPMDEILKSCSGRMAYSRGSLLFRVGAPTAPVLSLNNSQELISQPATYSYFPDAGKMYNGVRTRYPEPLALWSEKEAPAQYVSAYLTEDREWVNIADVTLPAVPFPDQAWRLSNAWLKDNRRTRRHILRFPLSTLGLEPMDTINYTDVTLGYTDKLFEIDQIEDDHERNVRGIHIREIDPSDYDAPALYPDAIPTSSGTPTITAYTLTAWTFSALDMVDSAGRAREAGVLFTVTEDPPEDIEAIEWELYLDITGAPILSGTTDGLGDLIIPIFQGILPFTTYHGRLKPLSRQRETTWTALKSATTSDIRLSLTDLGADVQAAIAAARPDGTTAAEAAETAQRLAVAAQNLAEAAKTDAEAAQLAAETAQGLAETAKADSEAIQTAVNAALSDAETAETAAETAQGLAERAKTAAEIAKGLAEAAKIASEKSAAASEASRLLSGSAAGEASASKAAAALSETNAATSASTAATSETNAATSKTQAGESASAASTSASTASTQAGIATTKAGVATTQAGIATTKAGEASTSETNAATSRTNAETSESNAATSARNAATSKTAAGDSASAASTSSSTATTQAGIATTKAGEAATKAGEAEASATTASEKAGEATTKADEASTSASTASTQAGIATTKAGEASTSETSAATSKTNAKTSESNAKTSETNAANSKSAAGTSETNARDSASAASRSASTASTKADEAGTKASTATTQAGIATTKAGEASTSASNAAISETNAEGSASSAAASASLVAVARTAVVASFNDGDGAWVGGLNRNKAYLGNAASLSPSAEYADVSLVDVEGTGQVLQFDSVYRVIFQRNIQSFVEGQQLRVRIKTRLTTDPTSSAGLHNHRLFLGGLASDGTNLQEQEVTEWTGLTVADGWIIREIVIDAVALRTASTRTFSTATEWFLGITGNGFDSNVGNAVQQFAYVSIEDVTVNAGVTAAARAAQTSASIASAKADEAGASAATATTQAGIATTKAGEASTSETSAATSKTGAGISETNAATSARNAATSKTQAGDSASAASGSASTASTKASEAGQSASAASASKDTATTKAGEASTSASDAATSETNAEGSESSAATSARNAATSKTQAGDSASAASESASTAATKADEASTSASTASTQAGIATTKAGEASTSETSAATSETNAEGSETNAATSARNAATSQTAAGVSASAANASAMSASTKADEAGVSATAASGSVDRAVTKAAEAAVSASNAATSETNAETAQAFAERARGVAARVYHGEAFNNPIFTTWTATYPDGVVGALNGGTVTKDTTGKYGNAILVNTGANPIADSPQLRLRGADAQVDLPSANDCIGLSVSLEIEAVSGMVQGGLVRAMWDAGGAGGTSAQKDYFIEDEIITSAYGIVQNLDLTFPRPSEYVAGSSGGSVQIVIYATSAEGGNTRSQAAFKIHRWNVRALAASASSLLVQQAVATIDGVSADIDAAEELLAATEKNLSALGIDLGNVKANIATLAAARISLRVKAGTANAQFELIALDDNNAYVASQARISADNILLDGSVTASTIKANSITADRLRADVRNWDPLWAGTRGVTTAWSTFSLLDEIPNFQWIMVCVAFRINRNDPTKNRYLMEMFSAANPNEQASGSDLVDDRRGNDDVFFEKVNDTSVRLRSETGSLRIASIWGVKNPGAGYAATPLGGAGTATTDVDYAYRLGTSTPSTPTGGESTLAHAPTDWARSALTATATENVYRSSRTRTYTDSTFTSATVWSMPTLFIAKTGDTGGLPTPNRPTVTRSALKTTAATVTDGAYCTFQYGGNPQFSSPNTVYDTTKGNVHTKNWTPPSGDTYIRARLTTSVRDTGSKSAWSPTQTYPIASTEVTTTTDNDAVYRRGTSTPSTPTGGTSTLAHTPTNWSRNGSLTATTTQNVYASSRVRTYVEGVFTSATAWSTPTLWRAKTGGGGGGGTTTDTDAVYRQGTSAPSTPTGGTSTLAHTPTSWSRSVLRATAEKNVYRSQRTRTYVNGVFTSATAWRTRTLYQSRTGGDPNTDTDYAYRLGTSKPSKPTGGTSTAAHTPTDWSRTAPAATTTQNVYRSSRTRTYVDGTFTSATAWRTPTLFIEKGGPTTGGLPVPNKPQAGRSQVSATADNVVGGAYCTFQHAGNPQFSSPDTVYDTTKDNTHTAQYPRPRRRRYFRARLTTGIRDTGSKSGWSVGGSYQPSSRGQRGSQIPIPAITGERFTDVDTGLNSIKLSGRLSTSPDDSALTCRFRLVSGAPCTLNAEFDVVYQIAEEVLVFTDANTSIGPGEYVFEISVSDGFSSATAQVTVAALNSSPGGR